MALIRALTDAGWTVDAVTDPAIDSPSEAGLDMLRKLPESARIHRWAAPALAASWRLSPQLSGGFGSIRQILETAARVDRTPSIVLASGPPFAEFLAAVLLARRYRVPCVLDYRDEWSTSTFAFVGRGSNDSRWERRCLAGAAAAVFATESMKQHYFATFPCLRSRVTATITNGWDDTGVFGSGTTTVPPDPARPAVIGFFGFLGEHWDFEEFVRTLAAALVVEPALADRIRIAVYGNVSPENVKAIEALGRSSLIARHGLVPHGDAQRRMASCDALILFNSPRLARVLPGKTFEYIASHRPILLYGEGGEMEALLGGRPGSDVVPRGHVAALTAALGRISSGATAAELATAPPDPSAWHRSHRDREWMELLEQVGAPPATK